MASAGEIKAVLQFILIALGGLSVVFALMLWGASKIGEPQGGVSEGRLMGAIAAAIAFFAASGVVTALNFDYKS